VLLRGASLESIKPATDWAQVKLLFRYNELNFALVTFCERALNSAGGDPLCPLTCAPRVKLSLNTSVVPVQDIWKLLMAIPVPDSRIEYWINWFVLWGAAAYPVEHMDRVLSQYRFRAQETVFHEDNSSVDS